MTLKQLQALAVNYKEDMKRPGIKKIEEQEFPVILELKAGNEELFVKDNGFAKYSDERCGKIRSTVFSIFDLKLLSEFTGFGCQVLNLSDFPEMLDYDAVEVLRMCGQDRLDYNTYNRDKSNETGFLDGNGNFYERKEDTKNKKITDFKNDFVPALLDSLEPEPKVNWYKKLHDAESHLTQAQAEVIRLCFYQNMTQEAAAKKLGLSRASVQDRLNGALKKLKKYILK